MVDDYPYVQEDDEADDGAVRTFVIKNKLTATMDEVVEATRILNKKNFPKYHKISAHNFWIKRNHRCVYCELGSKPLEDSLVVDANGEGRGKK